MGSQLKVVIFHWRPFFKIQKHPSVLQENCLSVWQVLQLCGNALSDHLSTWELHFSSCSLVLCANPMAGDDPWVADKIISVVVSAKAWAAGDLCRLSPDCYFVPSATLLTELSGFWSASLFPATLAAWKLQQGSLFTSHAIHRKRGRRGFIQ